MNEGVPKGFLGHFFMQKTKVCLTVRLPALRKAMFKHALREASRQIEISDACGLQT
jgi:hypothetical protein